MNETEELTSLEVLGIAIRGLIADQEVYSKLAENTENDVVKNRILNLYNEAKQQQLLLEKKYSEMFPNVELAVPSTFEESFTIDEKEKSVKNILMNVIQKQKETREYYLDLAETITDYSGKRCLRFLADMKFSHQMMLNAELEMIEKYPAYFNDAKNWDAEHRLRAERIKRH